VALRSRFNGLWFRRVKNAVHPSSQFLEFLFLPSKFTLSTLQLSNTCKRTHDESVDAVSGRMLLPVRQHGDGVV
jgi:hypothetical protein